MPADDLFIYLSATAMARRIREKKISAKEAVTACLARIAQVNPRLNAVVQLCAERAQREALQADAMLARGQTKGPLHGVPITIKDSFDTAGIVSTGGTLGRKDFIPPRDATVVSRVRAAGAIVLGKTNTPEFTLSFVTDNLIYGSTRNPYNLEYQPSGSSGGAAAIVAAGGSAFDIGSDFAGSIRVPSHACGIAGIKPTHGLVPAPAISSTTAAASTRCSRWPACPAGRGPGAAPPHPGRTGQPGCGDRSGPHRRLPPGRSAESASGMVRFQRPDGSPTPEIAKAVSDCVGYLSAAGAKCKEARPPLLQEVGELRGKLNGADSGEAVRRRLRRAGTKQSSPQLTMGARPISSPEFAAAVERLDDCRSRMLAFLEDYDLILCPPSATPPPRVGEDPGLGKWNYTSAYNMTGWPAAVVRAGTSPERLPLGIQIVGRPWTDHVVLAAAAHIESKTGGWQRPSL